MKKIIFIFLIIILLLFSVNACRQDEEDVMEVVIDVDDEMVDATVSDYFATVLEEGAGTDETLEDTSDESEEESDLEESTKDDDTVSYGPVECGNGVCQYYETHSTCYQDCQELDVITLGDYPDFLEDVTLVIGDEAPSTDALTAAVLGSYFVTVGIDSKTILASELDGFDSDDLVLIGSPCTNAALAELYHYSDETCGEVVSDHNNAVIKLNVRENNEIITITGYDAGDTLDASQMLTNDAYNLNGAEEWVNLYSTGEINVYYSKN